MPPAGAATGLEIHQAPPRSDRVRSLSKTLRIASVDLRLGLHTQLEAEYRMRLAMALPASVSSLSDRYRYTPAMRPFQRLPAPLSRRLPECDAILQRSSDGCGPGGLPGSLQIE